MAEVHVESATPWRVPGGPSRRTVGVALGIVLVAAVLWAAFRPADTRLFESIWELESATVDGDAVGVESEPVAVGWRWVRTTIEGTSVEIPTNPNPITWQFRRVCDAGIGTGPGCIGRSSIRIRGGCFGSASGVVYEGTSVRWDDDASGIAVSCTGHAAAAMRAVGRSGSFDYSFDGDRLVVTAPDRSAQLVFRSGANVGWGD